MTFIPLPSKRFVASFDVDAQNTFTPLCPNELPVPDGASIVSELNRQNQWAGFRLGSKDAHSKHAIWVADADNPPFSKLSGNNVDLRWPRHAEPGTKGFEALDGLPPITQYDYFVWKGIELDMHPYGACYHDFAETLSTGVIEFLQSKGVSHVLVGGLATDYCVKYTALQLSRAMFTVIVNKAACRGMSANTTQRSFEEMRQGGVHLIDGSTDLLP